MPRARYDRHNAPELAWLGAAIRDLREQQGLKQIEVAAAAEMSETQISEIERGKANPGWLLLTRLITRGLNRPMPVLTDAYDHHARSQPDSDQPPR